MRSIQDSHSIKTPESNSALLWIVFGLCGVVGAFIFILSLVPKY
jgi:hypothetical protein